jgi:hypothetical protein
MKRLNWFLDNRPDLSRHISYLCSTVKSGHSHRLLAIPSRERLERVLPVMLDEKEFLSPHGIRSLSRAYLDQPYRLKLSGTEFEVHYSPAESDTVLFGGNSNWRGPVWMPANYLLIEALERYHHFYGDDLTVECPTGSGRRMNLLEVAREIASRISALFLTGPDGARPFMGAGSKFATDPYWRDLVQFHEYFHGDTGEGLGASHQTGWTALIVRCLEKHALGRPAASDPARRAAGVSPPQEAKTTL